MPFFAAGEASATTRRPKRVWAGPTLRIGAAAAALLPAACQSYSPQSLNPRPPSWTTADRLVIDAAAIRGPAALATHRFDPSDGLDAIEVQTLAVVNNPELRLDRADLKIARAQAFAAGLIPDPQVALSSDGALQVVVGRTGFEPVTNGLKVRCSTN
jgi:outer membrane protein, heavy metal efflux system